MKKHEQGCVIEEAGKAVGVACSACGTFWECPVLACATGELVAAVLPENEDGCSEEGLPQALWEERVKAQVMAAGLAAPPQ